MRSLRQSGEERFNGVLPGGAVEFERKVELALDPGRTFGCS
jgi:hypothetical protein